MTINPGILSCKGSQFLISSLFRGRTLVLLEESFEAVLARQATPITRVVAQQTQHGS